MDSTAFGSTTREKIFVNEHLTPYTRDVLVYAREVLKNLGYRVDTRNCIVHVKHESWAFRRPIHNREQIHALWKKHNQKNLTEKSHRDSPGNSKSEQDSQSGNE